jgi:hypothetical protein
MSAVKGLEQAISNLESIDRRAVPRASAQAINRVAARAISRSASDVSSKTRVPRKLVKPRATLTRATLRKPQATIRVRRGNLPAIKLGVASVRVSRRGGAVLQVGRFKFPGAFIRQLGNGQWHVLRREGRTRYPIEVVTIPLAAPLTTAFKLHTVQLTESDLPKELAASLRNQLRLIIRRR